MNKGTSSGMRVPVDTIEVGPRIRMLNPAQVAKLEASIQETGLLNPIIVVAAPASEYGNAAPNWLLVAGAHRLEACRKLGFIEIAVTTRNLGTQERIIAECDENLCGTVLGQADRALLTSRRKVAFEELHPETRHGATGAGRKKSRQIGDSNRFTLDAATKTSKAERTVQRDVLRGEAIDGEVLARIRNTDLDRGGVLDELVKTPRPEQAAKVEQLLQRGKARSAKPIASPDLAGAVGTAAEAGDAQAAPSAAAVWLVGEIGDAQAAAFVGMVEKEGVDTFWRALRAIVDDNEISSANEPDAENDRCEEPKAVVRVVSANGRPEAAAAGIISLYKKSTTALDVAPPLLDEPIHAVARLGSAKVETESDGDPARHTGDNAEIPSGAGLSSESRLRSASWFGVDDTPQAGDRCCECRGVHWWHDDTGRGTWRCGGCFEPDRRSFRSPMVCTTTS